MTDKQRAIMPAVAFGLGAGVFSNGLSASWPVAIGIAVVVGALAYWIGSKAKPKS